MYITYIKHCKYLDIYVYIRRRLWSSASSPKQMRHSARTTLVVLSWSDSRLTFLQPATNLSDLSRVKLIIVERVHPKRARNAQSGLSGAGAGRRLQDQQMWSQYPAEWHPQRQRDEWLTPDTRSQVAGEKVAPNPTEAAGAGESTQERTSSIWMERKREEVKEGREEISCRPEDAHSWKTQARQPCRRAWQAALDSNRRVWREGDKEASTVTAAKAWCQTHGRTSEKPLAFIQERRALEAVPEWRDQTGPEPLERWYRKTAERRRVAQTISRRFPPRKRQRSQGLLYRHRRTEDQKLLGRVGARATHPKLT